MIELVNKYENEVMLKTRMSFRFRALNLIIKNNHNLHVFLCNYQTTYKGVKQTPKSHYLNEFHM
jgi:hypothetical protein